MLELITDLFGIAKNSRGIVKDLLTSASYHSRGIKVRLEDGQVGRVAEIIF